MKNFYQILEVSSTASVEVIRASGKALSVRWHPDKPHGDEEKFKQVQAALHCLTDPQKRALYDQQISSGWSENRQQPGNRQSTNGHTPDMKPVWRNGIGWVLVAADSPGFPSDGAAYPEPYPQAAPFQKAAEEAIYDMAHDILDQTLRKMFRGRFR